MYTNKTRLGWEAEVSEAWGSIPGSLTSCLKNDKVFCEILSFFLLKKLNLNDLSGVINRRSGLAPASVPRTASATMLPSPCHARMQGGRLRLTKPNHFILNISVGLSVSCENAGRSSQANHTKPFYSKYLSLALCVMRECREVVSG